MPRDISPDISFDEWVASEQKLFQEFCAYWAKQHELDPDNFPLRLGAGDWSEQYYIFCETRGAASQD